MPKVQQVREYFIDLQTRICNALAAADGQAEFSLERLEGADGALAQPRVLANGAFIEKAAVQFTHSKGASLPPAATARNPQLAGRAFEATAVSLIVHPRNPYAPTTHMNLRFFTIVDADDAWYFGGGFDLTPYYGFEEDCVHWHQTAADAVGSHYPRLKQACDEYFYLGHRQECRGIGGIFYDDWVEGGFEASFQFTQAVGEAFIDAYLPILEARKAMPYGEAEREWQLYRRGRYAEFNLAIDRGTQYGMQSGRRIESVLASLPPLVAWHYNYAPVADSPEATLLSDYLPPRDWLSAG
ncbi:MAG: oxygen-dependent coproporphyrinogen oxidase [Pseudomonadota bacterium]